MVDYLRITSLAAQRLDPDLAPWQVDHDFIELGDNWTETRKIRVFRSGPSLKGRGDAAHYPYGLDGSPPRPGPDCDQIYNTSWREELDATWSRVTQAEFEAHFADASTLDRHSPLTAIEEVTVTSAGAIYCHYQTDFSHEHFPTDIYDENVDGRIVRRVEFFKGGVSVRDNLYIQRRREFSIVYFNGSLAEGEPYIPDFDRKDISIVRIDRQLFEQLYTAAIPYIDHPHAEADL